MAQDTRHSKGRYVPLAPWQFVGLIRVGVLFMSGAAVGLTRLADAGSCPPAVAQDAGDAAARAALERPRRMEAVPKERVDPNAGVPRGP